MLQVYEYNQWINVFFRIIIVNAIFPHNVIIFIKDDKINNYIFFIKTAS
jgi:hypothetical protein